MIKIIWALIGINTIALLVFIGAYFVLNAGKHVDVQEKGWTSILSVLGLIVILLAALPLYYSKSTASVIFSGIVAVLPLTIFTWNKLPSFKRQKSFAETFYTDKTQRSIASAIEKNDTTLLKELIKGQDLNVQGTRVWDADGFNYLQFAVHLRSNPMSFPFDDKANKAAIKTLLDNGADPTSALAAATDYLPLETITLLLDKGANPNCKGYTKPNPLLFYKMGPDKDQNDIAILLLKRGADKNAINDEKLTPVMSAAFRAGITDSWADSWRVVRYLLEEANADYSYTNKNNVSLTTIVRNIRAEATAKNIVMPENFNAVVEWLKRHEIETEPVTQG